GVAEKSTVEYMLYHQNRLAQVNDGSRSRASSQIFGDCTSLFDCRQNLISHSSRKYHPLPATPWVDGHSPVRYVSCTEQVTAGSTPPIRAAAASFAQPLRNGMRSSSSDCVRPTTLRTTVRCMDQQENR